MIEQILELELNSIYLKDSDNHEEDFGVAEFNKKEIAELFLSADNNGYISSEKAPDWLKRKGFQASFVKFPVKISHFIYNEVYIPDELKLDSISSMRVVVSWKEYYSSFKNKSRISAKVNYSLE